MTFNTRRLAIAAAAGLLASAAPSYAGAPTPGGWAMIQADGTLAHHVNVTRVTHPRAGVYRITFNQNVQHCAATATIAAKGGKTIIPGYIVAGHNHHEPDQIRIFTFETITLIPTDYKFDMVVTC
jgi:hypothetical protein